MRFAHQGLHTCSNGSTSSAVIKQAPLLSGVAEPDLQIGSENLLPARRLEAARSALVVARGPFDGPRESGGRGSAWQSVVNSHRGTHGTTTTRGQRELTLPSATQQQWRACMFNGRLHGGEDARLPACSSIKWEGRRWRMAYILDAVYGKLPERHILRVACVSLPPAMQPEW